MVSWAKVDQWASLARQHRPDGTRGPRAARAWRRLVDAGDAGDPNAADQMWRLWTERLDDESWQCLARWRQPTDLLDAVFATAVNPRVARSAREPVLRFCRRHGLAPVDPADRAVYFLLTGQADQHEALDPDGALLVTGYTRAHPATQAELRTAMVDAGSIGFVRLLTDDRHATATDEETVAAVSRLARDEQWERLWRLARTLRLDHAVLAARQLGGWRPADPEGRGLVDRLAAADPAMIAAVVAGAYTRIETTDSWLTPAHLSVAPDGSELALFGTHRITLHSLPDGREVASFHRQDGSTHVFPGLPEYYRTLFPSLAKNHEVETVHRSPGSGSANGVHLGHAVAYLENHAVVLRRRPDWVPEHPEHLRGDQLVRVPGGFVVGGTTLTLCTEAGHRTVDIEGHSHVAFDILASEPDSGRLAVTARGHILLVLDSSLELLGRDTTHHDYRYRFLGPDRLIGTGAGGQTSSWRVADNRLVLDANRFLDGTVWFPYPTGPVRLVPNQDPSSPVWLDPATLSPVDAPTTTEAPLLTLPGGEQAVFAVTGGVELRDLRLGRAAALLGRPLSNLGPTDLRPVADAAAEVPSGSAPAAALDLLLACLHYRVGTEIRIGPVRTSAAADDIALGEVQR